MSSDDLAIHVENLGKCYQIYDRPHDRLKQSIVPRLRRMVGATPRSYAREFWALRDVSFDVRRGETVGIIGRNGSGKSTLLQMICGTVTPTTGAIRTNGRVAALLELGAGFNPEFTGRENVYLNAALLGLTQDEVEQRFDRIAAFADIGSFIESPVKQYSSGMFARLAFSVAIHVDPEILIVDEILAVGDAAFQRRCMAKFYEVRERGCTILFVSHDQYQVKSICQRALYLDSGRQVAFGPAGRTIDLYMIDMEKSFATSEEAKALPAPAAQADGAEQAQPVSGEGTGDATAAEQPQPAIAAVGTLAQPFVISRVALLDADGGEIEEIQSGEEAVIEMDFRAIDRGFAGGISFVFNLYRHDGLYICGSTTIMDGLQPYPSGQGGTVRVRFPDLPLLSGRYKWRVAINDHGGFSVLAEAKDVCQFTVVDNFDSVGLVNLQREWQVNIEQCGVKNND
ncbi:ABC transporter ATP-binding protein [Cupriavidus sp. AU9028]|uniref:ABC transporter ATP-binding protein n=1 Tax=Cupriavidus sp. AU9028 TaxID=2871157 RepID=UPI001C9743CC|nr:ABC transporter ATP-binding protein [Cupriavidus sp. AU9028]MBY4898115.1 ABC transporter ATP-binding protein [Cupriavidus sp. AU9028]